MKIMLYAVYALGILSVMIVTIVAMGLALMWLTYLATEAGLVP